MNGADWSTAEGGREGGAVGTPSVNGIVTLQPPPPLVELGVRET